MWCGLGTGPVNKPALRAGTAEGSHAGSLASRPRNLPVERTSWPRGAHTSSCLGPSRGLRQVCLELRELDVAFLAVVAFVLRKEDRI